MKDVLNVKFGVLFVKIIIVACIFFTKNENALAYASTSNVTADFMVNYINTFTIVTVAILGIQILFTLLGVPFNKLLIPYQVNLQIIGLFGFICFILMRMQYRTISYLWGVFCFIPFLIDIVSVVSKFYQNRKYKLLKSS